MDCSDSIACTVDSCNETTDSCDNAPDNAACSDGVFCNGADVCDALVGCEAGGDPCPGQLCDETADACVECFTDADCLPGETCEAGVCQPACAAAGEPCTTDADCCPGLGSVCDGVCEVDD